jgi:FkbM family methyltransferase
MIEKLKRYYRLWFKNPPKHRISYQTKIERHGSIYGGWNIMPKSLTEESIVYTFGIGEDISFDLSLIQKYNCTVQAFDPTPRVTEWLEAQNLPKNFVYHPVALSNEDGTLTFYTPENKAHISHKAFASENSKPVIVECQKLSSILKKQGDAHIDLLKIDIEGFEYAVLENMIVENIKPKQLLVEFHHFFPEVGNQKTEEAILFLQKNGYKLFNVADSFCEFSFVRE